MWVSLKCLLIIIYPCCEDIANIRVLAAPAVKTTNLSFCVYYHIYTAEIFTVFNIASPIVGQHSFECSPLVYRLTMIGHIICLDFSAPLHPQTLGCYTNVVLLLLL